MIMEILFVSIKQSHTGNKACFDSQSLPPQESETA